MRIDLHCHSRHSKRPALWLMQKLGCPESFTSPAGLYALARSRGMDAVTITDHNVIDGCLEIAELPGTFISCEYTTYFPEDQCKAHVLAYDLTEKQHAEARRLRENIYDLTAYCQKEGIFHAIAHPLYSPNGKLTLSHIEKMMLLFKNFEFNADLADEMNAVTRFLAASLGSEDIARLVERHGFEPAFDRPWAKQLIAGSDDHSSLGIARAYTCVEGVSGLPHFWEGINANQARIHYNYSSPLTMARGIYGIAYQYYEDKLDLVRHAGKNPLLRFLRQTLKAQAPESADSSLTRWQSLLMSLSSSKPAVEGASLFAVARREAEKLIREDPQLTQIMRRGETGGANLDLILFDFIKRLANRIMLHFGEHALDRVLTGRLFDLFHSFGSAASLYTLLAPYFASYAIHARQTAFAHEIRRGFRPAVRSFQKNGKHARLAHFTDTFHEVNGVAKTLQQHLTLSRESGKEYTVITCAGQEGEVIQWGLRQFAPVGVLTIPEYPELQLRYPPLLDMLHHCHEAEYTHIHIATPGPTGLAGLAIARVLDLPVSATYHTAFPQYARHMTEDGFMEDVLWRYMLWFYQQMDMVYAPSHSTANELIERGLPPGKIMIYPRGVDATRFHPAKRSVPYTAGDDRNTEIHFLYVGRISCEKNLPVFAAAFKALIDVTPPDAPRPCLIVVGDGPFRAEMEAGLHGFPVIFTGYIEGEALAAAFASADVFVFPSDTDTFGNVVLEAQASGLPVIVSAKGGPRENMIPGETGLVLDTSQPSELTAAMSLLAGDSALRYRMSVAAREYAENRDVANAFDALWELLTAPRERETPAMDSGWSMEGMAIEGAMAKAVAAACS